MLWLNTFPIEYFYTQNVCINLINTAQINAIVARFSERYMERINSTGLAKVMLSDISIELI